MRISNVTQTTMRAQYPRAEVIEPRSSSSAAARRIFVVASFACAFAGFDALHVEAQSAPRISSFVPAVEAELEPDGWARTATVSYDGTNFLVVYAVGRYVVGARVSEDGTVLDPTGFVIGEANGVVEQLHDALVTDDMQLMDRGTFEIGQAVLAELEAGRTDLPRFLDACRTDELPAETDAAITRLEHLGLATRIELRPLRPEDARAMLRSMDIPGLAPLVDELVEYVGGHPLFLVETLRHLIETDSLRPGFSARLPGGRRVRGLVEARLARLSEPARALARVAAVLREDFTPERAAAVLGCDLMALCEPLVELSSAHIHDGHRFHFDLVGEVVLASVVPAMASAIRRKAAEVPFRTADSRA